MRKRRPKVDRRLFGSWKSDRRKTFQHFVPKPGATPESIRKLKSLFGKLLVRWGYGKYYTDLDGFKGDEPYEVIGRDAERVVIRCFDKLRQEYRLRQIHFEGEYYWLWAWGIREYFRKVEHRA